jgi:16S rRNA (cytosine967-C5)-methyltransferase
MAAEVISAANANQRPADEVLREFFKTAGGSSPEARKLKFLSSEVTRAVFDYYRWRGWVEDDVALSGQLRQTSELSAQFQAWPGEFSDVEFLERTLPKWARDHVQLSAALVRAFQRQPKLWLRARKGQGSEALAELRDCRPLGEGLLADTLEYFGEEDIFRTRAFQSGLVQIQDISSQAVGFLCDPQPGQTWWDACAGEGGKTLHLSSLMGNKGLIWATDRSSWRLRRLRLRAARCGVFNYRSAEWDGSVKLPVKTKFDGVLVDAPCSGVGTWGRNPHARWTTTPEDIRELAEIQGKLLLHAAAALKPGGRLVYSVCTLTRSETEEVADYFEKSCPGFVPLALSAPLGSPSAPSARHWFLPQDLGGNGMFTACWSRSVI